jgi:drug/metabolite transporter (DMT)-like permease
MAVLCTAVPVFAQSAAIRRIGSGKAALVGMIGPLLTIAFAALLLGEGISSAQMIGAALVIAGVAIVGLK